jgi:hypothetical protein
MSSIRTRNDAGAIDVGAIGAPPGIAPHCTGFLVQQSDDILLVYRTSGLDLVSIILQAN